MEGREPQVDPDQLANTVALLRRAVRTPEPVEAGDALDELMHRLLVVHWVLKAEVRASNSGAGAGQGGAKPFGSIVVGDEDQAANGSRENGGDEPAQDDHGGTRGGGRAAQQGGDGAGAGERE